MIVSDDPPPVVDDVDAPFLQERTTAVRVEPGSRLRDRAVDLLHRRGQAVIFGCVLAIAIVAGFVALNRGADQATLPELPGPDRQEDGVTTAPTRSVGLDGAIAEGGQRSPSVPELPPGTSGTTNQPATETETETEPSAADVPTLGQITDQIAASPDALGEKGLDLLKLLQEVQRETGEKRTERAEKALEEIAKWSEEDKLDSSIAEMATLRLEKISAGSD